MTESRNSLPFAAFIEIVIDFIRSIRAIEDQKALSIIKMLVVSGFLSGMLMSHNLWWGTNRSIPHIPLINVQLPLWLHDSFTILFVISLSALSFLKNRAPVLAALLICFLLVAFDQLRLQPWVYLYFFMLLPLMSRTRDSDTWLLYYRLIIAGIYWWSGLHKINHQFIDGNYAVWIRFFFQYEFTSTYDLVRLVGYGAGLAEMAIGAGFLFRKTRCGSAIGAMGMHLSIIFFLLVQKEGGDSAVIPWNIVMIFLNVLIFARLERAPANGASIVRAFPILAVMMFWMCPILNFIGYWDHFLSFSLYANKVPSFYVAIRQEDIGKIDKRLKNYFVHVPGMTGGQLLDVYWWSKAELNVPFYPERRVFKGLIPYFCALPIEVGGLVFLEINHSPGNEGEVASFHCGGWPAIGKAN